MKLDVCVVSKTGRIPKGLNHVPMSSLIVETSSPLGMARARAIQKVKTEWFAFIDDDVEILSKGWFRTLSSHIDDGNVRAIEGKMSSFGRGQKLDDEFNRYTRDYEGSIDTLRSGDRGYTHNTIIRRDCVADWVPSVLDLGAYEDYDITRHVLSKGAKWIKVPVFDHARHYKTFAREFKGILWASEGRSKLGLKNPIRPIKYLASMPRELFRCNLSIQARCYRVGLCLAEIIGEITR